MNGSIERSGRNLLLLSVFLLLFGCGCEQQRAKQHVIQALNPSFVDVTNGEAVLLHADTGYLAVIPDYRSHDHIAYSVMFSTNGSFSKESNRVLSGVAPRQERVDFSGVRFFVGYGGANTTSVSLDFGDTNTGITKMLADGLRTQDVSRLKYRRNTPLSRDAVSKAFK